MHAHRPIVFLCWIVLLCGTLGNAYYCPPYVDRNNVSQVGYNCPTSYRLVGKSDFYCCWSDVNARQICCNDRTRSLFHKHVTYGEEAIILNWPFLVLGVLLIGMVIVLPYTYPREGEMKQDTTEV